MSSFSLDVWQAALCPDRDVWQAALCPDVLGIAVDTRLFHDAECRLVHKYRVYKDPFPHPALREGVIPHLLSFVNRAMVIARLTHLNILIRSSGMPLGQVPGECFPGGASTTELTSSRWVSFACDITVLGRTSAPVHSPDIVLCEPSGPAVIMEVDMVTEAVAMDASAAVVLPPPGFRQFSWPRDDWMVGSDTSLEPEVEVFTGGSPWKAGGLPVDPPSLHVSTIVLESLDDSVAVQVGSSREESGVLSGMVGIGSPSTAVTDAALLAHSPLPSAEFLLQDIQSAQAAPLHRDVIGSGDSRSSSRIPRWRLAREGPFLAERSTSVLREFGAGCAFRKTTYQASDYVLPSGAFGVPLNYPWFLEWIGVPESASLLELGPGSGLIRCPGIRLWRRPSSFIGMCA